MTGLPDTGRSRAVLIGVSRYQALSELASVRNNLSALAEALQNEHVWGLPPTNCVVVQDPVSPSDILDPIAEASQEATDTLLLYYAGHGLVDPRGELHLALVGSDTQQMHYTAVPYSLIRHALLDSPANRKIVILDCFYSGRATGPIGSAAETAPTATSIEGTYVLAAATENEAFAEPPGEPFTAFTGALLRIIEHGIIGLGPLLDLDSIYREMLIVMRAKGLPSPHKRVLSTASRLALIRNPAFRPAPRGFASAGPNADPTSQDPSGSAGPTPYRRDEADAAVPDGKRGLARRGDGHVRWRDSIGPRGMRPPGDRVSAAVRSAVHRGLLVFNPPEEMRQGNKDRVEVGIARSAALRETLLDGLNGRGLPQFEEVETSSFMRVELKGDAFDITSYSATEQVVAPIARWEFDVLPIRAGVQTLILCVCLRVAVPEVEELGGGQMSVPVLERAIRIRVNLPYSTRRFLVGNWQWLVATAAGLGGGIAAWIGLFH